MSEKKIPDTYNCTKKDYQIFDTIISDITGHKVQVPTSPNVCLMARYMRNVCTRNYQNRVTGVQVIIDKIGDPFLRRSVVATDESVAFHT